jgi:hypothetical protein
MIHVAKFLPAHDWEELQKTKKKWATERKSGTGQVHEGRATVQMGAASVVAALYFKAATLIQYSGVMPRSLAPVATDR